MTPTSLKKVSSTLEFKLAVIVSLAVIGVAAFFSQELDYFAAASPAFMFAVSFLMLIFLTLFLRTISMALFSRHLYTYPSLPCFLLLFALLIAFFFPFTKLLVNNEFKHNLERRKKVVDKVYFREWPVDKFGGAKLPKGFEDLASDSIVRFCDDNGVNTTIFITFRQNTRAAGIAYIEGIKDEKDIEKFVNRKDLFPFYPIKYRKLDENWYAISSDKNFFRELNW